MQQQCKNRELSRQPSSGPSSETPLLPIQHCQRRKVKRSLSHWASKSSICLQKWNLLQPRSGRSWRPSFISKPGRAWLPVSNISSFQAFSVALPRIKTVHWTVQFPRTSLRFGATAKTFAFPCNWATMKQREDARMLLFPWKN